MVWVSRTPARVSSALAMPPVRRYVGSRRNSGASKGNNDEAESIRPAERVVRGYCDGAYAFRGCRDPNYRNAQFTKRHHHAGWQATPAARSEVRRRDQTERSGLQAV